MRYKLSDIAAICGGRLVGTDGQVRSVFTDSRSLAVGSGALFVAIAGANHDGHRYIAALYRRGVRAFIVEREVDFELYGDAGFVVVNSSLDALQALAAEYRSQFRGTVVAVTGSNGKTIVKEWIAQLAPASAKLFRSPRSYNSQVGVPLSVLMMEGDERVAVFEAGISQSGEMERLERILRPDIGVITNIGDAHQENFSSLAEKLDQKLGLFAGARTIVFSSVHPEIAKRLRERFPAAKLIDAARVAADGDDGAGEVGASGAEALALGGAGVGGRDGERLRSTGRKAGAKRPSAAPAQRGENPIASADPIWLENASLALAACDALGFDHAATAAKVRDLQPVAMRLELREGINDSVIVDDFYNSDINSLSIALDYLKNVAGGRAMTLILSDILQSGLDDAQLYARAGELAAIAGVERIIAIGTRVSGYDLGLPTDRYPTAESYLAAMRREDFAGRAVLIKGNRSARFEKLSHALQLRSHTTTLEVDLDAMIHNLNVHRALLAKGTKMMAMVKAAGYGHGDYEVAAMLQHQGVDYLAVAFADEGVALREKGITMPIVVLNADEDSFDLAVGQRLEPEIYNFRSLEAFLATAARHGERDYPIHIKLDVGMHRLGFVADGIDALNAALRRARGTVKVATIFAHLAASDEARHDDFTRGQIDLFAQLSERIMAHLPYRPLRHLANSAAIERFPQAQFDMCRLGIGLYGISARPGLALRHVSTLRTRIVQIKRLPAGESVGYGRQGMLEAPATIATVPVGYADGLDRHLGSGRWSMLVGGRKAPIVGRVCMDTCMIDVTGIADVKEGDPVVVFGDAEGCRVEDMARALDTIPYEVMTSVSGRIKRIFIKE